MIKLTLSLRLASQKTQPTPNQRDDADVVDVAAVDAMKFARAVNEPKAIGPVALARELPSMTVSNHGKLKLTK